MYLRELTALERELFVEAAVLLVRSDDEVSDAEDALLDAISIETGTPLPPPESDRSLDDLISDVAEDVEDEQSRRTFLMELAGVAVVDATAPSERDVLERFAEALSLTDSLADFTDFAERARDLVVDSRALITGERS